MTSSDIDKIIKENSDMIRKLTKQNERLFVLKENQINKENNQIEFDLDRYK